MDITQLKPAVQQGIADAAELFQQVQLTDPRIRGSMGQRRPANAGQATRGGRVQIIYAGWSGCAGIHDLDKLADAQDMGANVQFINVNPMGEAVYPAVGHQIGNGARDAQRYGLRIGSPTVLLIDAQGHTTRTTTNGAFLNQVQQALGQDMPQRQAPRQGRY